MTPASLHPAPTSGHVGPPVRAGGDLRVVALRGTLDIYSLPGLRPELEHLADEDALVIDLSEVTLIDSAGLGALLRLRNRSLGQGPGRFGLICPRRRLRRVFDITGLRGEFAIGPDLDAVRALLEGARVRRADRDH